MLEGGCEGSCRVGIYVRESRDDNEENYETIETQRDLLTDFVNRRGLGEVKRVYLDDNASGSSFDRKGLARLKEDAVSHEIELLVLKDLSRLGRNNAKTLLFLDFLEEYGVRVITYDGRYDSSRDNDTVGIETWFNERYVRDVSRKIRANIRFKIEKGEYLGRAPFGYVKAEDEKNRLRPDLNTAHIVREIYSLYKQGYGYSYIAKLLEQKKYPSPSEKEHISASGSWNAAAVRRILSNPVYMGDTVQGVSERVSFKSKKTRRLPPEKWVVTKDTHEPIITREEYEEARKLRNARTKASGPHKGVLHLLRDIAFCGRCGSTLHARTRKDRPMGYICSRYGKTGKSGCTSHYLKESIVRSLLVDEIKGLLMDEGELRNIAGRLAGEHGGKNSVNGELQRLGQLLQSKQRQQEIIYSDRLEEKISEQLFLRMNTSIESRIEQLRKEISRLKEKSTDTVNYEEVLKAALQDLSEDSVSRELALLLIDRIMVFDEGDVVESLEVEGKSIVIEFRF